VFRRHHLPSSCDFRKCLAFHLPLHYSSGNGNKRGGEKRRTLRGETPGKGNGTQISPAISQVTRPSSVVLIISLRRSDVGPEETLGRRVKGPGVPERKVQASRGVRNQQARLLQPQHGQSDLGAITNTLPNADFSTSLRWNRPWHWPLSATCGRHACLARPGRDAETTVQVRNPPTANVNASNYGWCTVQIRASHPGIALKKVGALQFGKPQSHIVPCMPAASFLSSICRTMWHKAGPPTRGVVHAIFSAAWPAPLSRENRFCDVGPGASRAPCRRACHQKCRAWAIIFPAPR